MLPPTAKRADESHLPDSPAAKIAPQRPHESVQVESGNLALKPEQVPQTLPWSSLNVKGAVRKPAPSSEDISFWRTPSKPLAPEAPKAVESSVSSALDDRKSRSPEVTAPAASVDKEASLHNTFLGLRREASSAWAETRHAVAESWANGKHAYSTWGVQRRFEKMHQEAAARAADLRLNVARRAQAAAKKTAKLPELFREAASSSNSSLRVNTSAWLDRSGQLSRKVLSHRVTIRIATGRRISPLVERLRQTRIKSGEALNRNWRLATSVSMAALSALLALGLILLVSRYQPASHADDTTSFQQNGPAPATQQAVAPVSAKTTPSKTSPAASAPRKTPPVVNAAQRTPDESVAASATHQSAPAHRAHHNADEDYVARDTYVYYGAKGKTSRR